MTEKEPKIFIERDDLYKPLAEVILESVPDELPPDTAPLKTTIPAIPIR